LGAIHQVEHLARNAPNFVVHFSDGFRHPAQSRMRISNDLKFGHRMNSHNPWRMVVREWIIGHEMNPCQDRDRLVLRRSSIAGVYVRRTSKSVLILATDLEDKMGRSDSMLSPIVWPGHVFGRSALRT